MESSVTFVSFFFLTFKTYEYIFEGGNQIKLRIKQQTYFRNWWMMKPSDALFIWPPLAQFSHRVSTTNKQGTFLSC